MKTEKNKLRSNFKGRRGKYWKKYSKNLIIILLLVAIIGINSIQLNATDNYKTLEVKIGEGAIDNPNLSKRINIPNLKDVKVKSVSNRGTAKLEVTDTQVNILVSGGNPSRKVDNPSKRTEQMRETRTNSNNSFSNTIQVSSGGINVTLSKDGTSKVISGTYTPGDSKYVDNQTSANYNSGGFSGKLDSYLYSGSYTPGDSKVVSRQGTIHVTSNRYMYEDGNSRETSYSLNDTINYNEGGYSGILTATANVTLELREIMIREIKTIEVDKKQGESWTYRG